MKKIGTLNAQLSRVIASMGHTDKLIICDSGFPIPNESTLIDLALTTNIPRFLDALEVVLRELEVEGAIIAGEMQTHSPTLYETLQDRLGGFDIREIAHEEFKQIGKTDENVAYVRTGEATPYANVALIAGVTFG